MEKEPVERYEGNQEHQGLWPTRSVETREKKDGCQALLRQQRPSIKCVSWN